MKDEYFYKLSINRFETCKLDLTWYSAIAPSEHEAFFSLKTSVKY